ncbi:MAG: hypothetical protein ACREXX_03780 [Gammaproteobacteria bacterium]
MKYIPLVALLLYHTIAIGAEELPAFKTQVTPYNAPPIILAQEDDEEETDEDGTGAEAGCEENTSKAECEAAPDCVWTDGDECVGVDDE